MKQKSNLVSKEYDGFPIELLNASDEERKSYFRDFVVNHEYLQVAINKTVNLILNSAPERLVFVCGPSGVGKTELRKAVKAKIVELTSHKFNENRGYIPFVDVEAMAPEQGSFYFPGLWMSALEKMQEPMLDHKISYDEVPGYLQGRSVPLSKKRKADYQEVLQNTLKFRGVSAFFIDEAHHMLRVSSGKRVNWSVDVLKSLTNMSRTPIILAGTYDLTTFLMDLNDKSTDQINQRTRIVDFPRYRWEIEKELRIFGQTTKKILRHMPLERTSEELVDGNGWEYFFTYSLGCIGSLKNWLMDAYSLALQSQAKTLTMKHLDAAKMSDYRSLGMYQSIKAGEGQMEKLQSEGSISIALGFKKQKTESESDVKIKPKKNNFRPGTRKATRDAVM